MLGVGANAAMFGIVDRLLLRGAAHVRDAHRVVRLYWTRRMINGSDETTSAFDPQVYANLVARSRDFTGLAKYTDAYKRTRIGDGDAARFIASAAATSNFMAVLGAPLELGRFFTLDEQKDMSPVVVLGYDLWQTEFGGDRDVVGRSIMLSDRKYSIVGVAPRGFTGAALDRVDVGRRCPPVDAAARHWGNGHSSGARVVARLKDGVTFEDAALDATRAHQLSYDGGERTYAEAKLSVGPLRYGPAGTEQRRRASPRGSPACRSSSCSSRVRTSRASCSRGPHAVV